jgi:hypothetical protein
MALLLMIARVELSSGEKNVLADLLAAQLDWDFLLVMAAHHGLEPLLFHHLHAFAPEIVPRRSVQTLREISKVIAGRNLLLASSLKEISAHLRKRGIEHIAYKGPLLAEVYYGNCTLRVFNDLDFLVKPSSAEAARDALDEMGFRDKYGLSAAQQASSFRFGFEHPFTAAGGVDLDLHWRLVQKFKARSLDMEGIWKRVTMVPFWGGEVPAFCPEDLLVALCLHAGHHGWQQLSQMCDLAQLFHVQPRLDWEIVRRHLGDSNTRRIVYVSLRLLREHWDAQIPEDQVSMISADPHVARLADRIQMEIWPSPSPALTTSSLRWMLDRSSGEDLADRLRLLAGSFLCPAVEDFEIFRLPLILSPLYPLLRVSRLACKYAWSRQV